MPNIRPARPADVVGLKRLMKQFYEYSVRELATGDLSVFDEHKPTLSLSQVVQADFPKDLELTLVAEENGRLIAYTFGKINERPVNVMAKEGFIENLFVAEPYRNSGIGRLLLEALEKVFARHGCTHLALSSFITNTDAIAKYHHLGFTDDSLIMRKVIHRK